MTRVIERFLAEDTIQEVPAGAVNNSNVTFTLSATPENAAAVILTMDGLMLRQPTHYSISVVVGITTITMVIAPAPGQTLYVEYLKK